MFVKIRNASKILICQKSFFFSGIYLGKESKFSDLKLPNNLHKKDIELPIESEEMALNAK